MQTWPGPTSRGGPCCAPAALWGVGCCWRLRSPCLHFRQRMPVKATSRRVRSSGSTVSGAVTLTVPQVEMGQGIYTAQAMLVADELDVDLAQVTVEHAPADDRLYGNPLLGFQVTGGSTSVRAFYIPLRRGRRRRPHDADRGGRRALGGRCHDLRDRERHRGAPTDAPPLELWRAGRSCRRHAGPAEGGAEDAEPIQADRHPRQAPRRTRQGQRRGGLRHRRQAAGHEDRDRRRVPGLRRQARIRGRRSRPWR